MSGTLKLTDLPASAVEQLKAIGHDGFDTLAIEAGHLRDRDRWATYPRDPVEAARAAGAALGRNVEAHVDDGLAEISDSLRIANLILSAEKDLDGQDCAALAWLLSRAEGLLRQERTQEAETRDRLWRIGQ